MTSQEVIEHVGTARFENASEFAWATAAFVKRGAEGPTFGEQTQQAAWETFADSVEVVMESEQTPSERVRLLFELYRAAPSYTLLSQFTTHYWRRLGADARAVFWREARVLLGEPDERLSAPVEYALWCGFFEDPDEVESAWAALTGDGADPRVTERVLLSSGPVPFPMKLALYERLLPDAHWHAPIYESLLYSAFDYYGQINPDQAKDLLDRLDLEPGEAEHRDRLERRLNHYDEMRRRMRKGEHVDNPDQFYSWLNAADDGEPAGAS